MWQTAYLIVSGAGIAGDVTPALLDGLAVRFANLLLLPTPNAARVLSLREIAAGNARRQAGNAAGSQATVQIVESYFDPAITPRPPHGLVVVAPCTFNSLNHLALGLSPNLAMSVVNEAIGRHTPVIIGIACNEPLWHHPQAPASAARLREWGCHVLEPVPASGPTGLSMVSVEMLLATVDAANR